LLTRRQVSILDHQSVLSFVQLTLHGDYTGLVTCDCKLKLPSARQACDLFSHSRCCKTDRFLSWIYRPTVHFGRLGLRGVDTRRWSVTFRVWASIWRRLILKPFWTFRLSLAPVSLLKSAFTIAQFDETHSSPNCHGSGGKYVALWSLCAMTNSGCT
jgi:hypothetical protein